MISVANFLTKHSTIALGYFLCIALIGVFLRLFAVVDIPGNYRFVVHAHSHVALLGWAYTALTTLIYFMFLNNVGLERSYKRLFWFTQLTIIGMLVTFPFSGYALFSIVFSTLFLLASYRFAYLVFTHTSKIQQQSYAYLCTKMALWYMIISSLGPWALGIIMKTAGSGSAWYRNAIYFYLHFQYNGWFILALFGIFFYLLERRQIVIPKRAFQYFFRLMNLGIVLTFGISCLWMKPHSSIYIISALGALLQLIAFVIILRAIPQIKTLFSKLSYRLLLTITIIFVAKLIFQFGGAIPAIANSIATNVDAIIGYLHWIFLGVVSISLLLFLQEFRLIRLSGKHISLYILGFLLTEGLIFYKVYVAWSSTTLLSHYFHYLVVASGLLLVAIALIFVRQFLPDKLR